jgi:hypothetical protein
MTFHGAAITKNLAVCQASKLSHYPFEPPQCSRVKVFDCETITSGARDLTPFGMHVYEVRPCSHCGVNLIFDVLPYAAIAQGHGPGRA